MDDTCFAMILDKIAMENMKKNKDISSKTHLFLLAYINRRGSKIRFNRLQCEQLQPLIELLPVLIFVFTARLKLNRIALKNSLQANLTD